MLRITRIETSDGRQSLRVEGRLTHDTAEELRMACDGASALHLDVSRLQFVDPTGVALLRGLARGGTRLAGSSGFLNGLLRDRQPPSSDDETALVASLRAGDPQAFERLVRRYGGRMLATARRIVGNEDAA